MNLRSFITAALIYIYLENSISIKFEKICEEDKTICKCEYMFFSFMVWARCINLGISQLPTGLLSNITLLNISNNEFTNFDVDTFLQFPVLQILILDGNKLTRTPTMPETISTISLNYNPIEIIEPYTFLQFKQIDEINIKDSALKELKENSFYVDSFAFPKIKISGKWLSKISSGAFRGCFELEITGSNVTRIPARMIKDSYLLGAVDLSSNKIYHIDPEAFKDQIRIVNLILNNNMLTEFPLAISHLSFWTLDLGWNNISSLGNGPILNKLIRTLLLAGNQIKNISKDNFRDIEDLEILLLHQNEITHIADGAFRNTIKLDSLWLQSNRLKHISSEMFYVNSTKLKYLYIFDNPLQDLEEDALSYMAPNSTIYLKCEKLKKLPVLEGQINSYCVPETMDIVFRKTTDFRVLVTTSLGGMVCDFDATQCTLCKQGHFGNSGQSNGFCYACPPGGYYQDMIGYAGVSKSNYTINCKTCPVGSFSPSAGARSVADCQTCPRGTKTDSLATLNACDCLDKFHRTDRYGPCQPCPVGVDCTEGVQRLNQGYWWSWVAMGNAGSFVEYKKFVSDMGNITFDEKNPDELNATVYIGQLPAVHICLRKESCLGGGIDGNCSDGYSGWLCAACSDGHYELFNECYPCQNIAVIITIFVVIIIVLIVIGYIVWKLNKRNASMTSFLTHIKITINFYQILGILSEVNEINWPDDFQSVGQSLQYLDIIRYVNILSPKCIISGLWNAYTLLYIAIATPFAIVILASIIFCLLYLFNRYRGGNLVHNIKDKFLSVTIIMLYLTYANTCSNIMAVGPWSVRKFNVTANGNKDVSILTSDYSIDVEQDDGTVYNIHKNIMYYSLIYVLSFPAIVIAVLYFKYKRNNVENVDISSGQLQNFGMMFFFIQYTKKFWYWEVLEMYNKAFLAFIANIKDDQASNMSYSLFITVVLIALHLYLEPIENKSHQRLKLLTLCFIVVNLSVGAIVDLDATLYTTDSTIILLHDITPFVLLLINFSILFFLFVDLMKKIKENIWDSLRHPSASNNTSEIESDNNDDSIPLTYHDAASFEDRELLDM